MVAEQVPRRTVTAATKLLFVALLGVGNTANAILIEGTPSVWQNEVGTFEVQDSAFYGAGYTIRAAYDPATEVLRMDSTHVYYGFLAADLIDFEMLLSVTALVREFTGEFVGGTYSMISGSASVPELDIAPGALLLQGTVLEMTSRYFPCDWCSHPDIYLSETGTLTALLQSAFVSPQLDLVSQKYLHLTSQVLLPPYGDGTTPWASPFDVEGQMSWQIWNLVQVPEPSTISLLALALAVLGFARRSR